MHIKPNDLVLEIGSGNNPHPRADILCDRYLIDNSERAGSFSAVVNRPFVIADGFHLPFSDKQFDYVICSHILEHMDNPKSFLAEIVRVAKRGYIEVPSIMSERIFGWNFHHWHIALQGQTLVFHPKTEGEQFGGFFHRLIASSIWFRRFFEAHEPLWYVRTEWENTISFTIGSSELSVKEKKLIDSRAWKILQTAKPDFFPDLVFFARWMLRRLVRKTIKVTRNLYWMYKTLCYPVKIKKNVGSILTCVYCKGNVIYGQSSLTCVLCHKKYHFYGVIPVFLKDEEIKKGY